jgi:RecA-family ATPase
MGTEPLKQRWLAAARILRGDLTLYSGNGGAGKTETAVQLLVAVTAGLGDWLGCVVERGPALFLSCEEPEPNIRDRIERICRHRRIDPHAIEDPHLHFPDLEATWLATADRLGKITKTALLQQIEAWISAHRPILVVIDSIASVFDGEAIARRQVRSFLAMVRKIARENETAIMLLTRRCAAWPTVPELQIPSTGVTPSAQCCTFSMPTKMIRISGSSRSKSRTMDVPARRSNCGGTA